MTGLRSRLLVAVAAGGLLLTTACSSSDDTGAGTSVSSVSSADDPTAASEMSLPAVTTPVPVPGGGSVDEPETSVAERPSSLAVDLTAVADVPLSPTATVGPAATASPGGGISVAVDDLGWTELEGSGPGELSGPGLLLSLRVLNGSEQELAIGNLAVTVLDAEGQVAPLIEDDAATPLPDVVPPGDAVVGSYAFAVPESARGHLRIEVEAEGIPAVVVFEGETP